LCLPEEFSVFGPETRLEFEPLQMALNRELRHGDRLRIVLAGDPERWELEEWSLLGRLRRWRAEEVQVELLIPSSIIGRLDAISRNRLASWAEAELATVLEIDDGFLCEAGAWLIAEVGGATHHARFATIAQDALFPGSKWGTGERQAQIVRVHYPTILPSVAAFARTHSGESLRVRPPGTVAAIKTSEQLNGSANEFGARFWALVFSVTPELQSLLASQKAIRSIVYRDRYLRSPFVLRLLLEVLRHVINNSPGADSATTVRVETIPIDLKHRGGGRWLWSDWKCDARRDLVFEHALLREGMRGTFLEVSRTECGHARELQITWDDQATWTMRLDEGLGFMMSRQRVIHDFQASPSDQAASLLTSNCEIVAARLTYFYVFSVV
jgi:hypothetical protein